MIIKYNLSEQFDEVHLVSLELAGKKEEQNMIPLHLEL